MLHAFTNDGHRRHAFRLLKLQFLGNNTPLSVTFLELLE